MNPDFTGFTIFHLMYNKGEYGNRTRDPFGILPYYSPSFAA
ncbi:hypothetical protein AHIS2_p088 [Acaryochloris phage A-HIS2]|nr:hypothetical protein AHIS2_p088 [Acaryochloris phage A-HIS2]